MIKKVDATKMLVQPAMLNVKTYQNIADAVSTSGIIGRIQFCEKNVPCNTCLFNYSGIEGFLKFEVEKVDSKFTGTLNQGCMVDINNTWKIELRLKSMENWHLQEGTHIKAVGKIVIGSYNRPFLFVTSPADVMKLSDRTLTAFEMSEAWDTPIPDQPLVVKIP